MEKLSPYYNQGFNAFMNKETNPYDYICQMNAHKEWNMGYSDAEAAHDG